MGYDERSWLVEKMLFSNFRVSRSARLDRYEYVYFLKTNEDQVILERQPCTTRLANSNKTFFVKTTIGFQFVDLKRVRRNENDKKNQDEQKKNVLYLIDSLLMSDALLIMDLFEGGIIIMAMDIGIDIEAMDIIITLRGMIIPTIDVILKD